MLREELSGVIFEVGPEEQEHGSHRDGNWEKCSRQRDQLVGRCEEGTLCFTSEPQCWHLCKEESQGMKEGGSALCTAQPQSCVVKNQVRGGGRQTLPQTSMEQSGECWLRSGQGGLLEDGELSCILKKPLEMLSPAASGASSGAGEGSRRCVRWTSLHVAVPSLSISPSRLW